MSRAAGRLGLRPLRPEVGAHCITGFATPFAAVLPRSGRVGSYAVELGLQLVLDVVDDGGPAMALYDRLGWHVIDHRLADWRLPDGRRPRIRIYLAPDQALLAP